MKKRKLLLHGGLSCAAEKIVTHRSRCYPAAKAEIR
jgi:hypothetical protein